MQVKVDTDSSPSQACYVDRRPLYNSSILRPPEDKVVESGDMISNTRFRVRDSLIQKLRFSCLFPD